MADIGITDYNIQKQMYMRVKPITPEQMKEQIVSIGAWFSTNPGCNYYMLMCKELSDYTVIHFNNMNYDEGSKQVQKLAESRGEVLDILYNHAHNAYEIYVKKENAVGELEPFMYYLFEYNWGVIEIG